MGLCYKTTKWADSLWQGHINQSRTAQQVVKEGKAKQAKDYKGFAEDIHSRLYLRNEPEQVADTPSWADQLHTSASELAEWSKLRQRCERDAFAAGIAAESILRALAGEVPQGKDEDKRRKSPRRDGEDTDKGNGNGNGNGNGDGNGDKERRKRIRKACREAGKAVEQAEGELEGLSQVLGFGLPGTQPGENTSLQDVEHIRALYNTVKGNYQLQRIAALAGKLKRVATASKRSKVQRAVGPIKGIELSGDISRIIPSELADLNSNLAVLRLAALSKIIEKRALSYKQEGDQPEAKGPVVVLVDESGSMISGQRDAWAKALALALLATCSEQNRSWHLAGFSYGVNHTVSIEPKQAKLDELASHLCRRPDGGTNFDDPLTYACDTIEQRSEFKTADILLITDGEAGISDNTVARINELKQRIKLNVFALTVGFDCHTAGLQAVADKTWKVRDTESGEAIEEVINL